MVEQQAFNLTVAGSTPAGPMFSYRKDNQMSKSKWVSLAESQTYLPEIGAPRRKLPSLSKEQNAKAAAAMLDLLAGKISASEYALQLLRL